MNNNVVNPTVDRSISRVSRTNQNRSTRRAASRRAGTANRGANRRVANRNMDMYGMDGNLAYDTTYNSVANHTIPVSASEDTNNDYAFFKRNKANDETPDTPEPTTNPEGSTNRVNPTQPTQPSTSPVPTGLNDDISTTQDDNIHDLNDTTSDTYNNNIVRTRSITPAKRAMK